MADFKARWVAGTQAANHGRGAAKRKGAGIKIIDMEGLLVRLVDNLVSTSASEVSEGDEVLKTQAHFYRVLIANCERKAEMAEQWPKSSAGMMRHDGRDTHYSAVGRVRRAILFDGARLLLREIIPHRDRNDNYCGYNQSTDDIFHFTSPP
jgi:hypothetical protein